MNYNWLTKERLDKILADLTYRLPRPSYDFMPKEKVQAPENWERNLMAKLMEELSDGCYEIGSPPVIAHTGKGGYIQYQVALQKELKGYL